MSSMGATACCVSEPGALTVTVPKQPRTRTWQCCTGDVGGEGRDAWGDGHSDVVTLATDMSAYTDRSLVAGSSLRSSGQSASTVGGRAAQRSKKQRGRGKIRQGTPEEEQQLALLLSELAPAPELCSQVRWNLACDMAASSWAFGRLNGLCGGRWCECECHACV